MAKNLDDFDKIIVLDFGSQYNQLITRRIRDFGIYSELLPHDLSKVLTIVRHFFYDQI